MDFGGRRGQNMKAKSRIKTCALLVLALAIFFADEQTRAHGPAAKPKEVSKKALTEQDVKRLALFKLSAANTVLDAQSGLEWVTGPDGDTTWDEARQFAEGLSLAGGGWRLPTRQELQTLYVEGAGTRNMAPLFQTIGWWVWSSEEKSQDTCWLFDFHKGREDWSRRMYGYDRRAFAVRKQPGP